MDPEKTQELGARVPRHFVKQAQALAAAEAKEKRKRKRSRKGAQPKSKPGNGVKKARGNGAVQPRGKTATEAQDTGDAPLQACEDDDLGEITDPGDVDDSDAEDDQPSNSQPAKRAPWEVSDGSSGGNDSSADDSSDDEDRFVKHSLDIPPPAHATAVENSNSQPAATSVAHENTMSKAELAAIERAARSGDQPETVRAFSFHISYHFNACKICALL